MRRWIWTVLAACGRVGFDAQSDAPTAAAHDEDGDGIPDTGDDCPFLADPGQQDADGDGVGDACDPEPAVPRQHLSFFAPMADDTPCDPSATSGGWTKTGDAWVLAGAAEARLICATVPVRDTDIWIGADLVAWTGYPEQIALDVTDISAPTYYYGDMYDDNVGPTTIAITEYDGINYITIQNVLPPKFHAGALTDHVATRTAATGTPQFTIDTGWPSEMYMVTGMTPAFVGRGGFLLNLQHVDLAIRYIAMIETVP